jgi:mevalonate pyrophosphate decarboxylase
VDVIKLITKGTIEEDILQLANTKLQLDEAVAGDEEASKQTENEVKKSLIQRLRKQLEQEDTVNGGTTEVKEETDTGVPEASSPGGTTDVADISYAGDMLSALPAALLAAARSGSGSASPAGSLLRAEETPPATQSPTPLPTPPENIREQRSDIIMVDD